MTIERYEKSNHILVIDRTGPKPVVYHEPKNASPSTSRRIANFAKASVKHVKAGRPKATDVQVAERFAICEPCEFLNKSNMRCGKCGCGVKSIRGPISKLAWADSKCPVGKWGPITSGQESS